VFTRQLRPLPSTSIAGDPLRPLRTSLTERVAALRGVAPETLPAALLDVTVERTALPGGAVLLVRPIDWDALRGDEVAAGRPVPYWATPWPSGLELAAAVARAPPPPGARVLELGCGLGLPSAVAARAGARVLATDGATDAVAYAAHTLAVNELEGDAGHADWREHGDALVAAGPWDLVLAADVLYTRAGVEAALRLLPHLLAPGGELLLADPDRTGAGDFLAAARVTHELRSDRGEAVALHRLRARPARG
jgi:predicted nicotinamide N-methyase